MTSRFSLLVIVSAPFITLALVIILLGLVWYLCRGRARITYGDIVHQNYQISRTISTSTNSHASNANNQIEQDLLPHYEDLITVTIDSNNKQSTSPPPPRYEEVLLMTSSNLNRAVISNGNPLTCSSNFSPLVATNHSTSASCKSEQDLASFKSAVSTGQPPLSASFIDLQKKY